MIRIVAVDYFVQGKDFFTTRSNPPQQFYLTHRHIEHIVLEIFYVLYVPMC